MAMDVSRKGCPNYLRGKGKVFATTLSDSNISNADTKGECDSERNYKAFMTIVSIDSKNDLSNLVDELGNISEDEEIEESGDEDVCQNEGEINLQEARSEERRVGKECLNYLKGKGKVFATTLSDSTKHS